MPRLAVIDAGWSPGLRGQHGQDVDILLDYELYKHS